MKSNQSTTQLLRRLWHHISPQRRRQFVLLLGLTALSSFAEVVSLSAVMPFIGIITQPEKVFGSPLMSSILQALGTCSLFADRIQNIKSGADLVLPLSIAFAMAALFAGGLRLLLLRVSIRLGNATGADLSIDVYRRTLYQSYSVHVARSSSEIISSITQKVASATSMLISVVNVITSAVLFVAIMMTLLAIDPIVAIVAATSFGSAYGIIARQTRLRLVRNSQRIAYEQTQVVKALQEGLGAIRDIILDGTQEIYCGVYRQSVLELQRAGGENNYISQAPRYAMEALGMVLIAVFVLAMSHRQGGVAAALPILGMLALGAQRLLPLMQQLYGNWSVLAGNKAAMIDVLGLLEQPLPAEANQPVPLPLALKNAISYDNVRFHYAFNEPWVLDGINLVIPKGARIGFIGSTGSGKSTALDLLMGLLEPTEGKILVDGQPICDDLKSAWRSNIAHVPQSIFLADTTIAENIAFGIPLNEIDLARVRKAAEQARIAEFIEGRPEGFSTLVGERGVRLSGGQRQRIGIARALYKQACVLIFDEATSALDSDTELAVMGAIENLDRDLTILIIAHRLTTLRNCDAIVQLENGKIAMQSTYEQLANRTSK